MKDALRFVLPVCFFLSGCGCGGDYKLNESAKVKGTITAALGGTITATTGDSLFVPPGAVTADTEVTLTPFSLPADAENYVVGGARLEPDGLVFEKPVTVTYALAENTPPGTLLKATKGRDVGSGLTDMGYALVVEESGTHATGEIYSFSVNAAAKNCHGGTMAHVLQGWAGISGRSESEIAAAAVEGLMCGDRPCTAADFSNSLFDPRMLQQAIAPYFTRCGSFTTGVQVSADTLTQITATVGAGRMVVMMFGSNGAPPSNSDGGTILDNVIHSAVVVDEGGRLMIRNRLNLSRPTQIPNSNIPTSAEFTPIKDLPLDEIDLPNGLRDKRNGEVSMSLVGETIPDSLRASRTDRAWSNVEVFCERPRDAPVCTEQEAKPNGSCNGSSTVCIGTVTPCTDSTGNTCCPSDMCNYFGTCVQLTCPAPSGRNYDCECCCTAGQGGSPGSCSNTTTQFNLFDDCRPDRLCGCATSAPTTASTCGP